MTRKEWSEIAAVIRGEHQEWEQMIRDTPTQAARAAAAITAIACIATQIALVFRRYHSRFDVERFLSECGLRDT